MSYNANPYRLYAYWIMESVTMYMQKLTLWLMILIAGLVLSVACSPGSSESEAAGDEAAIYAAVIRQLAGPDDTFGGTLDKPVLYILRETNDAAGDPTQGESEPRVLSTEVQNAISLALDDLPSTIVWVDGREQVEMDEQGQSVDGGVIITLGNIHPQPGGEVRVPGSIYIANMAAGGKTYVLEEQDGAWTITGTTGAEWIS